jgi:hypothetical protein
MTPLIDPFDYILTRHMPRSGSAPARFDIVRMHMCLRTDHISADVLIIVIITCHPLLTERLYTGDGTVYL